MSEEMNDVQAYVDGLIARSRAAQKIFETYDQAQVDRVVKAIGKAVYDNAVELGTMAAEETGMGTVEYKIAKNRNKPMATWWHLRNKKSVGVIKELKDEGLVLVAKPIGVVGCITPTTNPTMTPAHNGMITLKGRNSMIVCPHPRAKKSTFKCVEYMRQALKAVGAPEDLLICVEKPSLEISQAVMRSTDVCISTGGASMVKVAYASGKPAYGVGAGNNQCLVDRDVDLAVVAPKIIQGRIFDNGISCTCEQAIICPKEKVDEMAAELRKNGAYYIDNEEEAEKVRNATFIDGKFRKDVVGQSVEFIANIAGIKLPEGTRTIVVRAKGPGKMDVLGREKMFPVMALYTYDTWDEAIDIADANLAMDGRGHSVSLHSFTDAHIKEAAMRLPVSRFLVNGIGSSGLGGAYTNGLAPTGTLGCGSWGNNSISENLDYKHLINVSRIAYTNDNAHIPTPDEVWG
ncbi:MAG: aldehyde dehydrogenase family protein [Acidaminococcus sp.]|jgi:succinate-semialdehyde dehydrogenase|nr:aldehyde dehydrogenase family protein [Acidaminococcus sp.]MCI2100790.1 aldehyde dehydrogenase family protein [Acidaminococcus sp.]MCI2115111.1 aldehyde dehydrogenase family protein [Acidaminococcus sp.]MCI2117187.1 aldehyde dehydrogenase family protein [Acidaminococcus sp.]